MTLQVGEVFENFCEGDRPNRLLLKDQVCLITHANLLTK
jgi:hypothetical protein